MSANGQVDTELIKEVSAAIDVAIKTATKMMDMDEDQVNVANLLSIAQLEISRQIYLRLCAIEVRLSS
jgi:hypothetical protein